MLFAAGDESPLSCRPQTTIKMPDGELVVTLAEARRIKAAADRFLVDSKLQKPSEPFIDCEGVVRMGAWILESRRDDQELRLTLRTVWTENVIVREEMRIKKVNNRWKALGMGQVTYHALRH